MQYSGEDFTRCDEHGNVFKGLVVFMIDGLKNFVSVVTTVSSDSSSCYIAWVDLEHVREHDKI